MTGAKGLSALSLQLTRSRFRSRQGESLLYLASTFAYVVCAALALTVAGGTWMFYNRWQHPTGILAEMVGTDPTFETVLLFYFVLAIVACALVVPSMVSLAASAAVLGARGRERRLATLRLIGLSSGEVTRMSLIDTLIQAALGSAVGFVIYWATLPLWHTLTLIALPVEAHEMWLPWWLLAAVLGGTVLIGLAASWWGLRQVRISPLGVARRASRPALRAWRIAAFVVVLALAFVTLTVFPPGRSLLPFLVMGTVILVVVWGINLVAPWLLQQASRLVAQAPSPSLVWAARRVQANPRGTWQRVSGLMLLTLIGGYIAMMPITLNADAGDRTGFFEATLWDFTKGSVIALSVGLVLTATSILITQASAVLERAEQSRALDRMGAPRGYISRVTWLETLGPLVVALAMGTLAGASLALPMAQAAETVGAEASSGPLVLSAVLAAGVALTIGALAATQPLQRQVLAVLERRND